MLPAASSAAPIKNPALCLFIRILFSVDWSIVRGFLSAGDSASATHRRNQLYERQEHGGDGQSQGYRDKDHQNRRDEAGENPEALLGLLFVHAAQRCQRR